MRERLQGCFCYSMVSWQCFSRLRSVASFVLLLAPALATSGCTEVIEWFGNERHVTGPYSDVSDQDYCNRVALASLHAEAELSTDIGGEFESDHVGQGPNTMQRNVGAYREQRRYQLILSECLRLRAESRGRASSGDN